MNIYEIPPAPFLKNKVSRRLNGQFKRNKEILDADFTTLTDGDVSDVFQTHNTGVFEPKLPVELNPIHLEYDVFLAYSKALSDFTGDNE